MENLKELLSDLTPYVGLIDVWKEHEKNLEKKDININIVDFDDTLFSRKEQLENPLLRENRARQWIEVIFNNLWVDNFINDYYLWKKFPQDIINLLDVKNDLILTAWEYELQHEKIEACNLSKYKKRVVALWEDKIIETIRYVLYDLWYIPKSITLYEDRPEIFLKYKPLIEWVLWTTIIIKKVVMKDNSGYESIEEV